MMPLFFLGSGHGAVAALQSLQQVFACIEVVSTDLSIQKMVRASDILRENLLIVEARLGVMAGNLEIIPNAILKDKCLLNVHYSLLPRYRGLHSVVWAMLNLETEYGLTVHIVNSNIDDGPIVFQYRTKYKGQTSAQIMSHLNSIVAEKLGAVVTKFAYGECEVTPQDKSHATWVPRRNIDDCLIPFNWGGDRLRAFFLALVRHIRCQASWQREFVMK